MTTRSNMQIGVANATFLALVVFSSAVHASSTTARAIRGRPPCENVVVDSKSHERVLRFHESVSDIPTHHLGGRVLRIRNLLRASQRRRVQENNETTSNDATSFDEGQLLPDDVCFKECDPASVVLSDYPQWQEEEGYWIGEYSLYQSDGSPFQSANWNYRYDAYRGFITGNVQGNAYRQRNVFFYPPQFADACDEESGGVVGGGVCGDNGNTKIFAADQNATTCSTNPELGGDIVGKNMEIFDTTTELIGADNALLYQVYLFGGLFQSQLTTLSVDDATGQVQRTRTAQGFSGGLPIYASFYRERKVNRTEFYQEMEATVTEYNVLVSDLCTWKDNSDPAGPPVIDTGLEPGLGGCMEHLEESFKL